MLGETKLTNLTTQFAVFIEMSLTNFCCFLFKKQRNVKLFKIKVSIFNAEKNTF